MMVILWVSGLGVAIVSSPFSCPRLQSLPLSSTQWALSGPTSAPGVPADQLPVGSCQTPLNRHA